MSWVDFVMLVGAGLFAGFINTIAGGGSLLTMPLLIFLGLPAAEANASNRIALFIQNIFAIRGFQSKGVTVFPFAFWVAISACLGALLGAQIAVEISNQLFNRILAVVMVLVIILTVFKPYLSNTRQLEIFNRKRNTWSIVAFFFIGVYGGFIQAGVGFLIIAALTGIHQLGLARSNSIKVFVILCYTLFALIIFLVEDKIRWEYGFSLALGNAVGGWVASRWSVGKDDRIIRWILIVTVSALAVKLWVSS
jgi:hypothetical protein